MSRKINRPVYMHFPSRTGADSMTKVGLLELDVETSHIAIYLDAVPVRPDTVLVCPAPNEAPMSEALGMANRLPPRG